MNFTFRPLGRGITLFAPLLSSADIGRKLLQRVLNLFAEPWILESDNIEEALAKYNLAVSNAIDHLAPLKSFLSTSKHPQNAWYSPQLRAQKRTCRKYEKRWRLTHDEEDGDRFYTALASYHRELRTARKAHIAFQLDQAHNDPKMLYRILQSFTNPKACENPVAPSQKLCDISAFLTQKIETIYDKIVQVGEHYAFPGFPEVPVQPVTQLLGSFPQVTQTEVESLIRSVKSGSPSDNVPAKITISLACCLSPSITHLLNLSLREGTVQMEWKVAQVMPIRKNTKAR